MVEEVRFDNISDEEMLLRAFTALRDQPGLKMVIVTDDNRLRTAWDLEKLVEHGIGGVNIYSKCLFFLNGSRLLFRSSGDLPRGFKGWEAHIVVLSDVEHDCVLATTAMQRARCTDPDYKRQWWIHNR